MSAPKFDYHVVLVRTGEVLDRATHERVGVRRLAEMFYENDTPYSSRQLQLVHVPTGSVVAWTTRKRGDVRSGVHFPRRAA